jgi:hypothetical protein
MEITSQIASVEEELKLLKGEIKSVLKEIRAAVLNNDNPFTSNTAALRAVSSGAGPLPVSSDTLPATPEATPGAVHIEKHNEPASLETPFSPPAPEPIPLHAPSSAREEPPEPRPSLFTIASLLTWSEDAVAALGTRRYRLMLELAYAAELLSPEVRDVLRETAELWPSDKEPERPVSVNDCLLQLRQLEAILNGERVARLPRRRMRRRSR